MWLLSSWCGVWLCCLGTTFVCRRRGTIFICMRSIQTNKIYSINDKKSNQWSSLCCKNRSYKYSSHNSNIKCVNSTIKYTNFEPIHYAINLNVVSSFMIFNDFDYMFLLMYR